MGDDHAQPHGTWAAFRAHLLRGLAITGPLILVSLLLENSRFGERLSLLLYEFRGQTLASEAKDVVIADVTGMPQTLDDDERANVSREALMSLLKKLAALDPPPLAIGIDIDLAPRADGMPFDEQDPALFKLAHDLGVPVVVGVYRDINPYWPANSKDEDGPGRFPRAGQLSIADADKRIVPSWIRNKHGYAIHGLAAAMVKTQGSVPQANGYYDWVASGAAGLEREFDSRLGTYVLIDCSGADQLEKSRIKVAFDRPTRDSEWSCKFSYGSPWNTRKFVLVGMANADNAKDNSFHVPPDFKRNYPGVYMHACAIDTFLKDYLYRPTAEFNVLLDFGAALIFLLMASFFVSKFLHGGQDKRGINLTLMVAALIVPSALAFYSLDLTWALLFISPPIIVFVFVLLASKERKAMLIEFFVALILVQISVLMGTALIRRTHLIWDGFVFVSLGLGLHLLLDRWVERKSTWTGRSRWIVGALAIACIPGAFAVAAQHHHVEDKWIAGPENYEQEFPKADGAFVPGGRSAGVERSGEDEWKRGKAARDDGRWDDALEAFSRASETLKTDAGLWIDLANALMKRRQADDLERALRAADTAIRLAPKDWRTHYSLACAEALRGDATAALDALEGALKCDPIAKTAALADEDLESLRPLPRFRVVVGP